MGRNRGKKGEERREGGEGRKREGRKESKGTFVKGCHTPEAIFDTLGHKKLMLKIKGVL